MARHSTEGHCHRSFWKVRAIPRWATWSAGSL
jgi:hypothetical protein